MQKPLRPSLLEVNSMSVTWASTTMLPLDLLHWPRKLAAARKVLESQAHSWQRCEPRVRLKKTAIRLDHIVVLFQILKITKHQTWTSSLLHHKVLTRWRAKVILPRTSPGPAPVLWPMMLKVKTNM